MKLPLSRALRTAAFAACVGVASVAQATTASTNYSDLWWNPSEPGWGVNLSQQADVLFGTFFVYDAGENAVWYSTTFTYHSTGANGAVTYAGDLFQTSGPAQGTPWNPALLKYRQVGTATITFGDAGHALLSYTVNGVAVNKEITRQTFAENSLVGDYIGGTTDVTFNCKDPSRNGLLTTDPGAFSIVQKGADLVIKFPTCTYTGQYTQQGQVGRVEGIYECTNFAVGEATFTAMQSEKGGIVGNYNGRDKSCEFRGNIGGMRVMK
jgi:hypothetical protein